MFNAIALPAIFFTAKAFAPDQQTYRELIHLQKKFIWSNQTSNEPGRHKISPHLLFIPKAAGGLGLISIPVAIHTLAVKEQRCGYWNPVIDTHKLGGIGVNVSSRILLTSGCVRVGHAVQAKLGGEVRRCHQ